MEQKKEKGLRIRSCLTGAIWLALVFSTVISALLPIIPIRFPPIVTAASTQIDGSPTDPPTT